MRRVLIISDDSCAIKQIVNAIHKIKKCVFSIVIYDIYEFKNYISSFEEENTIYFIDTHSIGEELIEILKLVNKKDSMGKIIILNNHFRLRSLLQSQSFIYECIQKNMEFSHKVFETLKQIVREDKDIKVDISHLGTPITLNEKTIDDIYHWPNGVVSINYKCGNNQVLISDACVPANLLQSSFYVDKNCLHKNQRKTYTEAYKQFLVDLYLVFHIDDKILAKHFCIDASYIKKWANMVKYHRRFRLVTYIIGKIIISSYFKINQRGK